MISVICKFYNFSVTILTFLFSIFHIAHYILPIFTNLYLISLILYYIFRLKKPDPNNVLSLFGPHPKSEEASRAPEKVVSVIGHRGFALDVPENTIDAFKYCLEQGCKVVELDLQMCSDQCVVLHDNNMLRVGQTPIRVQMTDFESLKQVDVSVGHPERKKFCPCRVCSFDEAIDFLIKNDMKMILDIKSNDQKMIEFLLRAFATNPALYTSACVACFNPITLYQLRWREPRIIGALIYRPHMFYAVSFDAESNALTSRYSSLWLQVVSMCADFTYANLWKSAATMCAVSAVILHKDIVSMSTIQEWRQRDTRVIGWCVNRPVEKLYWRVILASPYMTGTVVGEPANTRSQA